MFLQSCRGDHFPFNGCSQDSDDSAVQYSSITVRNTITLFLFLKSWTVLAANGGGCSSAGRAGRLVIGRLLVQIPALATLPETRLGLSPAATPREPLKRDKRLLTMTCHDMTWHYLLLTFGCQVEKAEQHIRDWMWHIWWYECLLKVFWRVRHSIDFTPIEILFILYL